MKSLKIIDIIIISWEVSESSIRQQKNHNEEQSKSKRKDFVFPRPKPRYTNGKFLN